MFSYYKQLYIYISTVQSQMFFHYIDEEKISLRYEIPFVPIIVVENPFMCSYIFPLISYMFYKSFIYMFYRYVTKVETKFHTIFELWLTNI